MENVIIHELGFLPPERLEPFGVCPEGFSLSLTGLNTPFGWDPGGILETLLFIGWFKVVRPSWVKSAKLKTSEGSRVQRECLG